LGVTIHETLVYWVPFLVLIAMWVFFASRMKKTSSPFTAMRDAIEDVRAQNARIMKTLSEIQKSIEDRKT
jgi:hypothetical protein